MEFTAVVADLASALSLIKNAVPTRTTIPLLNNFLIRAQAGGIQVIATDMMVEMTITERCEVIKDGEVTVPAEALVQLLKGMPAQKMVTLKLDAGRVLVSCGRSLFNLGTLPPQDFPVHPKMSDKAVSLSMDAASLHEMISATKHTALPDIKDRYHLQGVNFREIDGHLVMVATDGQWLTRVNCPMPEGVKDFPSIIIPNKTVGLIVGLLANHKGEAAKVRLDERRIYIEVGNVALISNLVVGEYPDTERLIPAKSETRFSVKVSDLAESMGRLMVVYNGLDVKAPLAIVRCGKDEVEISAGKSAANQGVEVVETTVSVSSLPPLFGVNASLLASLAKLWPAESVLDIQSSNPSSPILVTSESVPDVKRVVMPMNPGIAALAKRKETETVDA